MASNYKDSKAYNSWESRTIRAIDGASTGLRSIWRHMALKEGLPVRLGLASVITAGSLGIGGIEYAVQDGPIGGTPTPAVDYDLSGDGLMARSYSYMNHEGANYFLMHDVDHYELYQWNAERRTIDLIAYPIARDIIAEISTDIRGIIDDFNLNSNRQYRGYFMTCDIIREPAERADGSYFRPYEGCQYVNDKSVSEITEIYEDNWAFWNNATEQMTAENYGINEAIATHYQQGDSSHVQSYWEKTDDNLAGGFGGWLAIGMAGAGISGIRRRAARKQQIP